MTASSSPSWYGFRTNASDAGFARLVLGLGQAAGGDRDDRGLRPALPQPPDGFQSAHAGHAHVHEHQIGMPFVVHHDGFLAARRRARGEAHARQQLIEQIAVGRHIVHDQHLPGGLIRLEPGRDRVRDASRNRVDCRGGGLEREREHAPVSRRALDDQVSAHQAREVPADGEPQPGASVPDRRIRLIERVEDPVRDSGLDSRAGVLDGDRDDVPVRGRRRGNWRERRPARAR